MNTHRLIARLLVALGICAVSAACGGASVAELTEAAVFILTDDAKDALTATARAEADRLTAQAVEATLTSAAAATAGLTTTPSPTPTATPQPPTPIPTGTDTPTLATLEPPVVITDEGFRIIYLGPLEAQAGSTLETLFRVTTPGGQPAPGTFFATLGDPPSDPRASHANGPLDQDGQIALPLAVRWPAGGTKLYAAFNDKVYEIVQIEIR